MKITQSDLKALYPVSDHALANVEHTLSALPEGKEKIVVKKKLSYAAVLAAVLTLLMVGAVAAAIHWDVMQFLYGKPVGSVEPLMEAVTASATDGRVTVSIGSVVHDGRALAIDWTIQSHQPDKPLHLEIERMTIGGKRVWPSVYSSLNCDWLRPGEEIRYGGDMLMLPEEFFDTYPLQVEMTVGVYEPLKPVVIEDVYDPERKKELEEQGFFAAMPEEGTRNLIGGQKMLCWHQMTGIPQDQWDQYDRREMKLSFTLEESNACALVPLETEATWDRGDFAVVVHEAVISPMGIYVTVDSYPEENTEDAAHEITNRNAFLIGDPETGRLPVTKPQKNNPGYSNSFTSYHQDENGLWYGRCRIWHVGYDKELLPETIALIHQRIDALGYGFGNYTLPMTIPAK